MGNQSFRSRKSTANGGVIYRNGKSSKKGPQDERNKYVSCPEFSGATPYKEGEDQSVNITLYRSYGELARKKGESPGGSRPDVRIYRRSTASLPGVGTSASLPRNFGRSRTSERLSTPNGVSPSSSGMGWQGRTLDRIPKYDGPPSASSTTQSYTSIRSDERTISSIGSPALAAPAKVDFPTIPEVKRKLAIFEETFRACLLAKYKWLGQDMQLSRLSIASRRSSGGTDVSLLQYLEGGNLPSDLVIEGYTLLVPLAIYRLLLHVRHTGNRDRRIWLCLAHEVLKCIATEVGRELTRMYEYQIMLVREDMSVRLLADHAAECIREYVLGKNVYLDRNSALRGVVNARPPRTDVTPIFFSVVIGEREVKWDLTDVFKKPGVRKEMEINGNFETMSDFDNPFPWKFYICRERSETKRYGFRGELLEWDFDNKLYRISVDEKLYAEEKPYNRGDVHQQYYPYKRLVGVEYLRQYLQGAEDSLQEDASSFVHFFNTITALGDHDREKMLVYRPLSPLENNLTWGMACLENTDLTRLQLFNVASLQLNLKGACLLLAEARNAHLDESNMQGCEMSYMSWDGWQPNANLLRDCGTTYVGLDEALAIEDANITGKNGSITIPQEEIRRILEKIENDPKILHDVSLDSGSDIRAVLSHPGTVQRQSTIERLHDETDSNRNSTRRKLRRRKQELNTSSSSASSTDFNILDAQAHTARAKKSRHHSSAVLQRGASEEIVRVRPPKAPRTKSLGQYQSLDGDRGSQSMSPIHEPRMASAAALQLDMRTRSVDGQVMEVMSPMQNNAANPQIHSPGTPGDRGGAMLKVLQGFQKTKLVTNMADRQPPVTGRVAEVRDVVSLFQDEARLVVVSGCPGVGKSVVTRQAAREVHKQLLMVPLLVDGEGCRLADHLIAKLMRHLRMRFRGKQLPMFYSWLRSHEQKILFVFDNVQLKDFEALQFSLFLDGVLQNVAEVSVLCSSSGVFYAGKQTAHHFRLGDLRASSTQLLQALLPDLTEEMAGEFAELCGHSPFTMHLLSKVLSSGEVDIGSLYTKLTTRVNNSCPEGLNIDSLMPDAGEEDRQILAKTYTFCKIIVEHLPPETRQTLSMAGIFQAPFHIMDANGIIRDETAQESWVLGGQTAKYLLWDTMEDKLFLPTYLKTIFRENIGDCDYLRLRYCKYYIEKVSAQCAQYHSAGAPDALATMWQDYDNILDAVTLATLHGDLYELISALTAPDMCLFLHEVLEDPDYTGFYQTLKDAADIKEDTFTTATALCCLAYHTLEQGNVEQARQDAETAWDILEHCDSKNHAVSRAFCWLCMGKVLWQVKEERETGLTYVKKALDCLKVSLGLRHPLTLYSYEECAAMQKEKGAFMKARHYYNVIDFVIGPVLGDNPTLLRGFDSRREIWERMGLFSRAADASRRTARLADHFYGEHPLTADMHQKLCDCLIKTGDITDAFRSAFVTLTIREKVLGDHLDTALSNKTIAYLLLRSGQNEEAIRYGQRALQIYVSIGAHRRYVTDTELIVAQARRRLQSAAYAYVRIEPRSALHRSWSGHAQTGSSVTAMSTEV